MKAPIVLLLTVVLSLSATAASVKFDSGELALSPVRIGPAAAGFRDKPVLVMGTSTFIVAWEERSAANNVETGHVWVRFFSPEGAPKPGGAIDLGPGNAPAAVWDGTEYFLVWTRNYLAPSVIGPRPVAEGLHLREDGTITPNSRITIGVGEQANSGNAAVSWSGLGYAVAWDRTVVRLDRFGKILSTTATQLTNPKISAMRGDFLVVGRNGDFEDGVILPSLDTPKPIGRVYDFPAAYALGSGTNEFVGVFAGEKGVTAIFLGPGGSAAGFLTLTNDPSTDVSLTNDGTSFLAVYTADHTTCYRRFTLENVGPTGCFARDFNRRAPSVDAGVSSIGLAVVQTMTTDVDQIVFSTAASPTVPDITDSTIVAEFTQSQTEPAILRDATGTTVLWTEPIDGRTQIWWGHVDANGVRAADQILAPSAFAQSRADIAPGFSDSLAVWQEQPSVGRIAAVRVSPAGEPRTATATLGIGAAPRVASNGRDWLVVWQGPNYGTSPYSDILTTIVTEGGSIASPNGLRTEQSDALRIEPKVLWNGREFVVIWTQYVGSNTALVRGVRVSANGALLGDVKTLIDGRGVGTANIAWNGKEYLVVGGAGVAVHVDASLNAGAPFVVPPNANVEALENGLFVIVSPSPAGSRAAIVGTGRTMSEVALPFAANPGLDLIADGNRLRIGYARDFFGSIPRVFLRIVELDAGPVKRRARR